MLKSVLFLLVLSVIIFLLFTFRLTEVPPGINGDEAAIGLNAAALAQTGRDLQGRFLPIFTNAKNSPDWKQPATVYLTALIFKLFGVSYFNLRLVSVIFVILSTVVVYFLTAELINQKIAVLAAFLFLTTPIITIQSHLAIENIAPIPFVALWFLMLVRYTKKQDNRLLLLAGGILGVSIFSYLGMRMIVPVLGILTVCYIYYFNREKGQFLNQVKWFLLGSIPFILILWLSKFYYPGSVLGQYRGYQIEDYQTLILPYLSSFDLSFLFLKGDSTPYHSTGKQGMFLLASLPVFILGLIEIISNKKPILVFALISFFLIPVFFGLGSTIHRSSRLLAMIPFYVVIVSVGVQSIMMIKQKILRRGILIIIVLLISLNFYDFLFDYWYQYPQRVKAEFARPIHILYEKLNKEAEDENLIPYVDDYPFMLYPDAKDFFKLVYFPKRIPVWFRENKIPPRSIILTDINNVPSRDKVGIVKVGELDYYFIINKNDKEI